MLFKPAQLGLARLDPAELAADRKACKKFSGNRNFPLDGWKSAWYNDITSFAGLLSAPVFTAATRTRGRFKTTVIMEVSTNDR